MGIVRAVPLLCELYPGISITTEEKVRKNLIQGSFYLKQKNTRTIAIRDFSSIEMVSDC
jgi:hypothetical protein